VLDWFHITMRLTVLTCEVQVIRHSQDSDHHGAHRAQSGLLVNDRHRHYCQQVSNLSPILQVMANHSSPRTTKLYDRRSNETSLDEYEKVN
jgi:hypothetical protein